MLFLRVGLVQRSEKTTSEKSNDVSLKHSLALDSGHPVTSASKRWNQRDCTKHSWLWSLTFKMNLNWACWWFNLQTQETWNSAGFEASLVFTANSRQPGVKQWNHVSNKKKNKINDLWFLRAAASHSIPESCKYLNNCVCFGFLVCRAMQADCWS